MKKLLAFLFALCILFSFTACSDEDPYISDEDTDETNETGMSYTLESVSGWWTKPEGFNGLTGLYTFCVDAERGTLTSYDEYGTVLETYECWYDDSGFTIDAGDFFGIVTYAFDGNRLMDEEGTVHYVRRDPIDPNDAPYTLEALAGTWYKGGEDLESLILEGERYSEKFADMEMGGGKALLIKHTTYYDASEYSGPALSLEGDDGFSSTLWVMDSGKVLFDDFHEEIYVKEGLSEDEAATLLAKYAFMRDDWYTEGEGGAMLTVKFFGELWMHSPNDDGLTYTTKVIGKWSLSGGKILVTYTDGGSSEFDLSAEEMLLDCFDEPFIRHEAW